MVINNKGNANILNKQFSNVAKNLRIPHVSDTEQLVNNISHPAMKAIMKYRKHLGIFANKNKFSGKMFKFSRVSEKDIVEDIEKLS